MIKSFCVVFGFFFYSFYLSQSSQKIDSTYTFNKNIQINPIIDSIITYSKTFIGTPYKYSGSDPSGFDCSGFVSYVFSNFGFRLSRSSSELSKVGESISLSNIQPGDLMFFKGRNINSSGVGHVALVIEVFPTTLKFIHSASGGVKIEDFKSSKYYTQRYINTKRIDYLSKYNK